VPSGGLPASLGSGDAPAIPPALEPPLPDGSSVWPSPGGSSESREHAARTSPVASKAGKKDRRKRAGIAILNETYGFREEVDA
jgi:hypothetical protein